MTLCCEVLEALEGKTLVTAESCTGGGIGAALTAVPGSSRVYKGGVISYTDWVKAHVLGVPEALLAQKGAVSREVAAAMAQGARERLEADIAVSVTGLAGPGGGDFGNPGGTAFIGYAEEGLIKVREFHFSGDRDEIREKTLEEALKLVKNQNK